MLDFIQVQTTQNRGGWITLWLQGGSRLIKLPLLLMPNITWKNICSAKLGPEKFLKNKNIRHISPDQSFIDYK